MSKKVSESIKIRLEHRDLLKKYKLCPDETYSAVIKRLIEFIEENNFHESQ